MNIHDVEIITDGSTTPVSHWLIDTTTGELLNMSDGQEMDFDLSYNKIRVTHPMKAHYRPRRRDKVLLPVQSNQRGPNASTWTPEEGWADEVRLWERKIAWMIKVAGWDPRPNPYTTRYEIIHWVPTKREALWHTRQIRIRAAASRLHALRQRIHDYRDGS